MAIAVVTGDRYTVESVYQWDSNQVLEIRGLSLPSTPEIHYTNDGMQGALVKQAKMDSAGVITADIPNTLLQKTSRILAYICIERGKIFETLYKIEIPIKPRSKPSDYTFEDTDGEIYSYNALENKVNDALNTLTNDYGKASENLDRAIENYNQAEVDLVNAKKAYSSAQMGAELANSMYHEALETLGGIDDGTVYLKKGGDAMGGALNMNGNAIENVPDPVNDGDAVNRKFAAPRLLWENPDPSADFAEQFIGMDLTGISLIGITFFPDQGLTSVKDELVWVVPNERNTNGQQVYHSLDHTSHVTDRTYDYSRIFSISSDGIWFNKANWYDVKNNIHHDLNAICKPLRIYKIL